MASKPKILEGLLNAPPRFLFFTGKGGVGKTSTAAATAVSLADQGQRVLLVSTDPASNLDEVLGASLGPLPNQVMPGLDAMNIDPVASAATYRERVVGPYRGLLPESALRSIEEQLSGACTVEIAAFDEFTTLLAEPSATDKYDHVIFDTAPTGHTLRLLALPGAWSDFIDTNTLGTSCIGPLAGLSNQQDRYRRAVATLADATKTVLVLVARPDAIAIEEAARASLELGALGIGRQRLVLNGVFVATGDGDPLADAMAARSRLLVQNLPATLAGIDRDEVGLVDFSLDGIDGLRAFVNGVRQEGPVSQEVAIGETRALDDLIDELARRGSGLVLAMGKGGVGKTTFAVSVALELARRGHEVELTTTDPADHLGAVLAGAGQSVASQLHVGRIDPEVVTRSYTAEVLARAGTGLGEDALAVLKEDLRSPCTEEIAVFGEFARVVAHANDHFVVADTAPTGHTVLLLDSAQTYHREAARQGGGESPEVMQLLERLSDPEYTSVVVVTLPEATPVHEAASLQADLERAGIHPKAWVVNQSLLAARVTDPMLRARAMREAEILQEVAQYAGDRVVVVPMLGEAPQTIEEFHELLGVTATIR
ncbi:arsenical pump-driving ATPase [Ferrimicrobium sp.]|uniref:arsenical pump-driving ATPase n=1 Tax=Ferrimicrobium sp. TaxID=2926050 RepID=UPI00262EC9E9|nr:arsenical pump-driving ATPase [Ferrimicrobium sp.]